MGVEELLFVHRVWSVKNVLDYKYLNIDDNWTINFLQIGIFVFIGIVIQEMNVYTPIF